MVKFIKEVSQVENEVVVGTVNKYKMRNPIGRLLVENFDQKIANLVDKIKPATILEVGCGEGHITEILLDVTNASLWCTDISEAILNEAKESVRSSKIFFEKKSIYELEVASHQANMVVCCEVLEHLEDPILGLEKLVSVAAPYCLLSVPREPIFRTLNFLRGSYLSDFGNSPGHLQHWSRRGFIKLVSTKLEILEIETPLPWTVILGKVR